MYPNELKRLFCFIALISCGLLSAQEATNTSARSNLAIAPSMQAELLSSVQKVAPGDSLSLALRLQPDPGWHFYWRNPGDTGLPTKLVWQENSELQFGELQWPVPSRADYQGFINYGYYGETLLLTEVQVSDSALPGQQLQIQADVSWLVCEEVCIPGKASLFLPLEVAEATELSDFNEKISAAKTRIPQALGELTGGYRVDGNFQLTLDLPDRLDPENISEFFPISAKLIDNLNPASISKLENGSLQIDADTAAKVTSYPDQFEGLIVAQTDSGRVGYSFSVPADGSVLATMDPASAENISFLAILIFALLGGLILNLMPCVLPVLSLKVMHLVEDRNTRHRQIQGLAYTAGVVLSFMVIAATMLALRSAGEGIGWGFQLQSPVFVAFLVYVVFILGLSLSGYLELGASLTRLGNLGNHISGPISGSFMTGALATVVATPCTAPFMGAAMGAALTMNTALAMLVFATLGLGLALPFLLISFVPAFARVLPRPGQWMVTLKELLAFPLYLTAIWLLWVFANQTSVDKLALLMAGLVLIVFGLWLVRINKSSKRWLFAAAFAVWVGALAILPGVNSDKNNANGINKVAYDQQLLSSALSNKQAVFVNLTADWCITCKVNERVALQNHDVEKMFVDQEILYLEGDWTNADEKITEVLQQFGRNGVPLYLAYRAGSREPEILPQILTPGVVIQAFSD